MEILTPQMIWKGYDPAALALNVSILSDKTDNGRRYITARFNGSTTTDGVARVYVRCVLIADAVSPAVVYVPDVHKAVGEVDVTKILEAGYNAIVPDYAGERDDDPNYTIYPRSMSYANFVSDRLTEVPEDMRFNCWITWAETIMRTVTFASGLEEVDETRIAVIGDGVSSSAVIKTAAVDQRVRCAVSMFASGQKPSDTEGQDYLRYKVSFAEEAYAPMVKIPLLTVLSSNEQDGSTDSMSTAFELMPQLSGSRLTISERVSHTIGLKQRGNIGLWLSSYLKGDGSVPASPELTVRSDEHRLRFDIKVPAELDDIDLFTSQGGSGGALRNWRRAKVEKTGDGEYTSTVDVYYSRRPLSAFVNATRSDGEGFSFSSPIITKVPAMLGVSETPIRTNRLVYDSDMGLDDWSVLSPLVGLDTLSMIEGPFGIRGVSSKLGTLSTFKIGDAVYHGTGSQLLQIMIYSAADQDVTFTLTACGNEKGDDKTKYTEYRFAPRLSPSDNWKKLTLQVTDFKSQLGILTDWERVVNLRIDSDAPVGIASVLWV